MGAREHNTAQAIMEQIRFLEKGVLSSNTLNWGITHFVKKKLSLM